MNHQIYTKRIINEEMKTLLLEIWNEIMEKKESEPFREPVAYRKLGLTDYPLVIKKIMDLGTLKVNLENGVYATVEGMLDDLQLIWDNCKLYNMDYSKIYKIAGILENYSQNLIKMKFGAEIQYGKNNPSYLQLQA